MKKILWMVLALGLGSAFADKRPNIVFLMADDHQAFSMGCAGNGQVLTPNMDRLAARGVVFDGCYSTSPLCMASRATVFTGMFEYKTGCNFLTGKLSADDWNNLSYAVLLRQAGYRTAFAGKWGFPLEVEDYQSQFDKWGGF
ncbi:MAG: sulfatase-like hydrolase/transferase, partial [Kiritimatiellales bacterium]|nr:sulfatase-like hydrolase/transferase [Kiritimatiellales bacterium]